MKRRDRERQEARRQTIVDMDRPQPIDVIGNADGVTVLIGAKLDGRLIVGGAQLFGARMIGPGLGELTRPDGRMTRMLIDADTGATLGMLWDTLIECAGVFSTMVIGPGGPVLDEKPDGSLIAAAWARHRAAWLAEHGV